MNSCIRNDWRSGGAALKLTPLCLQRADQCGVVGFRVVDDELLAARAHADDHVARERDLRIAAAP